MGRLMGENRSACTCAALGRLTGCGICQPLDPATLAALEAEMAESEPLVKALANNDGTTTTTVAVRMDAYSIHPCSDGYTWLCCMACCDEDDDDGTAITCISDAHPMTTLMEKIFDHALDCQPREGWSEE